MWTAEPPRLRPHWPPYFFSVTEQDWSEAYSSPCACGGGPTPALSWLDRLSLDRFPGHREAAPQLSLAMLISSSSQ